MLALMWLVRTRPKVSPKADTGLVFLDLTTTEAGRERSLPVLFTTTLQKSAFSSTIYLADLKDRRGSKIYEDNFSRYVLS